VFVAALVGMAFERRTEAWLGWAGLILACCFGWLALAVTQSCWARIRAGRRTLADVLPAELWASALVLPLATTGASAMLSVGLTLLGLTLGASPVLTADWRPVGAGLLLCAFMVGAGAPIIAALRIYSESHGEQSALFDPAARTDTVARTLTRRWEELRSRRRYWLAARRVAALGDEVSPSEDAWPSRWNGRSAALRPGRVVSMLAGLLVATVAGVFLTDAAGPPWIAYGCAVAFGGLLPATAIVLQCYATLAREQGEADLLRRAAESLHERVAAQRAEPSDPLQGTPRVALLRAAVRRRPR
jgi:hypothetical protein